MKTIIRLMFIILIAFFINITVYAYTEYKVGDIVSYNDIEFYVIKNSGSEEDSVTMLKAEPLTAEEINQYGGVGTANNHVNMYVTQDTASDYYQKAYNQDGYGGMAYYSSPSCGYNSLGQWTNVDCKNDYASSEVKL